MRRRGALKRWAQSLTETVDLVLAALTPGARSRDGAVLRFTRAGVERAGAGARALLGPTMRRGAPLHALRAAFEAVDPGAAPALDSLAARGVAFRRRMTFPDRGAFDVAGYPAGGGCELRFVDASGQVASLAAADAARRDAEAEIAVLRGALDAVGTAVWLKGRDGAARWSNAAARAVAAVAPNRPETRRIEGPREPGGAMTAVLDDRVAGRGSDDVLRRFVETVTETFAHLRLGLAIYDSERRLTLANPAVAEIFGVDPTWLAGRPTLRETLDRLREARQLPEQLNYPAWRATLFTLFDDVARASYEERWELPDGRSIHVVGRPHPLGGIAFIFEDVTEAIALQRWRSTAVEVRRATLDLLADGVVVFGSDGQTRMANPAFVELWRLGARFDDAPRHLSDIARACAPLAPDAAVWSRIREAISGGDGRTPSTCRMALTDGRALQARIAPMPDGSTLAAFSDVTDSERISAALRERADSLEAAEDMRNALLHQISHRLRTPLNAIMGFTEVLCDGRERDAASRLTYLHSIRSASGALLEGVENLAALVSTGPQAVERARGAVPVAHALRGALGLLERRLAERNVRLDVRPLPETAAALGDPARLRQLIFNMLADATATAAPGETLAIGIAEAAGALEIWCEGHGLAAGRAETPGLALARRAAEANGGRLVLELPRGGIPRLSCRLPLAPPTTVTPP